MRESEEIRFDIIYSQVSERTRRVFTVLTGMAVIVLYGVSLPAAYSYVSFMKVERSAYLRVPINWLYCVFIIFSVACICRYCWLVYRAVAPLKVAGDRPRAASGLTMPSPFAICIVAIVLLGALGLPIGHSMIAGSILYLLLSGLDLGTAAEQILNGLFNSYVLLAIPLFILAADLMNIGSLTDRLLQFCLVLVGRFRGGLGHVNVVANMIFAGMSGSAIADAVGIGRIIIGMMTREGPLSDCLCRRDHRFGRHHRPYHSAIHPDGALCADLRHLDRLPVSRRLCARRDARHQDSWLQTRSSRDDATIRSNRRSRYAKSHALRCALSRR